MAFNLDISAEDLDAITTVRGAFDWVPWKGPAAEAFMFHLGLDPNEPPRTYAAIAENMIDSTFPQVGYLSEEQMVGLSPVDMGKAKLAWQACRVKSKMEKTASMVEVEQKEAKDMAKAMSSRSTTASTLPDLEKVNLNIANQTKDKEVPMMSKDAVRKCYALYKQRERKDRQWKRRSPRMSS